MRVSGFEDIVILERESRYILNERVGGRVKEGDRNERVGGRVKD